MINDIKSLESHLENIQDNTATTKDYERIIEASNFHKERAESSRNTALVSTSIFGGIGLIQAYKPEWIEAFGKTPTEFLSTISGLGMICHFYFNRVYRGHEKKINKALINAINSSKQEEYRKLEGIYTPA